MTGDEYAPFKSVTKKEYQLMLRPWISKDILLKCKIEIYFLKDL